MKWSFWIDLYIRTHCVARGLRPLTLAAYEAALKQFHEWAQVKRADIAPDQITARDVLAPVDELGVGGERAWRVEVVRHARRLAARRHRQSQPKKSAPARRILTTTMMPVVDSPGNDAP